MFSKPLWCFLGLHRWQLSPDGKTEQCLDCPVGGPVPGTEVEIKTKDLVLVDRLPMYVNIGLPLDWESLIGHAKVTQDRETGKSTITIELNSEISAKLGDMVDAFEMFAIGFAGKKIKNPEQGTGN